MDNVTLFLVRLLLARISESAIFSRDQLADPDVALVTFVGPNGPLAGAWGLFGSSATDCFPIQLDASGAANLPVGPDTFKADFIGLSEVSGICIADTTPQTINVSAPS